MEKNIKIKPLKLNSSVLDQESGNLKIKLLKEDLSQKIETGELESFLYDLAGAIKILKEEKTEKEEILKIIGESISFSEKEEEKTEIISEPVSEKEKLQDILGDPEKPEIELTDGHWIIEEDFSIKSGKKISGSENTSFNIESLLIDIPEEEILTFNNIKFGKSENFKGLIKVLKGKVIFNGVLFNNIKIECEGKSKVDINNCRWKNTSYPVSAKDNALLYLKNLSLKQGKVPVTLSDNADISNLEEFVHDHPEEKEWLLGSRATALKLIKLNNINIFNTLLKIKNIKLSGVFTINNTLKIDDESFSIEGFGEEGLTIKTELKQLFFIKNKGKLVCKNVTFEFISQKTEYKPSEDSSDYEEIKEPGFIHVQNGYLELINSKVNNTCNGIYLEKKSEALIVDSSITNNNRGIYINSSLVTIEKSIIEGNGVTHKDQPQIKIDNKSVVSIKESGIINSIDDSGIYISNSKVTLKKSSVKKNDIGISICEGADLNLLECEISNNRKEGIYSNYNSKSLIEKCNIIHNKSNGIVIRDNSESNIINSIIKENIRGLDIRASETKVSRCEFDRNVKGISVNASSSLELKKSLITNSKLNALCIESSRVKISDCKIKNNCTENNDYYQVYIGKKSSVKGVDTEISEAPEKLNDVYSEFENSRVIFEASQVEGGVTFGHKKNGCFITTAVCLSLGKGDNCYELNMFRKFRDNWLKEKNNGENLIKEYYSIAPVIVDTIDSLAEKEKIYKNIWKKYLSRCLLLIENENFEEATELYVEMVEQLKLN